jgi:uncharacterized membrane protein YebE (DUF533 family)
MKFNNEQVAALVRVGLAMAQADGHVETVEQLPILTLLASSESNDKIALSEKAEAMEAPEAITILAAMTYEQKKFATGYLASIMAIDGEIADVEVKLWQLISMLAGFPTMNVDEAIAFWHDNN